MVISIVIVIGDAGYVCFFKPPQLTPCVPKCGLMVLYLYFEIFFLHIQFSHLLRTIPIQIKYIICEPRYDVNTKEKLDHKSVLPGFTINQLTYYTETGNTILYE